MPTLTGGGTRAVLRPTGVVDDVINVDGGQLLRRGPDYSAMLDPVFGADGLRGVTI